MSAVDKYWIGLVVLVIALYGWARLRRRFMGLPLRHRPREEESQK